MAPLADQNSADKRRRATALRSQPPFHVRVPDVSPPRKPRPASQSAAGLQNKPTMRPTAHDPVAKARARLKKKRYDDGHQHVTTMIDRMRDKRRRLFGRLWIASVVLTAMSIIALAVEVIQGLSFTAATAESIPAAGGAETARAVARKPSARSSRSVVPAEGQIATSELSDASTDKNPVKSALYTTDGRGKPKGVWLDGTINDSDSDTSNR